MERTELIAFAQAYAKSKGVKCPDIGDCTDEPCVVGLIDDLVKSLESGYDLIQDYIDLNTKSEEVGLKPN